MAGIRSVTMPELVAALADAPAMCEVPDRLSLVYLPGDVRIVASPVDLIAELDSPEPQVPVRILCPRVDPAQALRLPTFRLDHEPLGTGLNPLLADRYDDVASCLLRQSQVAEHIVGRVQAVRPDCVIWLIVDGLAYGDLVRHAPAWLPMTRPVLVDGISTTPLGMRRLVGAPRLAHRLFDLGYPNARGFTYWTRDSNDLTDELFAGFGSGVTAARTIGEITNALHAGLPRGTYVQVIRDGVDGVAHDSRTPPPVPALVRGCLDQLEQLAEVARRAGRTALLYLCTDHGMLWRDEHAFVPLPEPVQPRPRYFETSRISDRVKTFPGAEAGGSALHYPYLRRPFRATEWGVHGGLSYEESVIPLVELAVF